MSAASRPNRPSRQLGYTLIEMMVAILIAMFLIAGVLVVEQSVHNSYADRSGLSQLDDNERFTMTLLSEVVQSAGYYPDPVITSVATALPAQSTTAPNGDALIFAQDQSVYGLHKTTTVNGTVYSLDSIAVRYMTANNDGIPLCDGTSNKTGSNAVYTNYFYILTQPSPNPNAAPISYLYCALETNNTWPAAGVQLVSNVQYMQVWYGLHTQAGTTGDYYVDTYVPAADMTNTDWSEVTSVRIEVTFANPLQLSGEAGQNSVTFTKVIDLMGRVGGA